MVSEQEEYVQLLKLMFEVAQSLEGVRHQDVRMHDCNKLALKLYTHSVSLYWLRQGSTAPDGTTFIDMASAAVITRAALETYLTMFEVFFASVSDDEREFRYALWFLSGFAIRGEIIQNDPTLVRMRNRIQRTTRFASLSHKQKQRLLDKGEIQMTEFTQRVKDAGFGPVTIKRMNRYLSGYVHSDGLSAVQIMSANTPEQQAAFFDNCLSLMM